MFFKVFMIFTRPDTASVYKHYQSQNYTAFEYQNEFFEAKYQTERKFEIQCLMTFFKVFMIFTGLVYRSDLNR